MNTVVSSTAGTRYLRQLSLALADAPVGIRDEIFGGIREELVDLDEATAETRIGQLGDPRLIAAEVQADVAPSPAQKSTVYLVFAVGLLAVGGLIVPFGGWVVGLVLVAASSVWSRREKRNALAVSIGAGVIALIVLMILRKTSWGDLGLAVFIAVPLLTNVCLGSILTSQWRAKG